MKLKQLEKKGMQAVKDLRLTKLKNGFPFMINSKTLPSDQCYLEYPDGLIVHVALSRKDGDFKVISQFSSEKGDEIRKKFNLVQLSMPDLYIITGANGAGKSTVGFSYLPKVVQENCNVFDGDKLTLLKKRELYKIKTPSLKEAGRMALEWLFEYFDESVKKALKENSDFVYEGHLPEDANWKTPRRFKKAGFNFHMVFFGLRDTDLSEVRVMDRAKMGGHYVPPYEIERNYYGNLCQLNKRFKVIDELQIVDTSESLSPRVLALFKNGEVVNAVAHGKLPGWFEKWLPKLYKKIIESEAPSKGTD